MDGDDLSLRSALVDDVRHIKNHHKYPDHGRAFQHWSAVNILGLEDDDVEDYLSDSKGMDGGIDYFYMNNATETVEIIQAKFSEDLDAKIGTETVGAFYEIPKKLMNDGTSRSTQFQEHQLAYKKAREDGYATNLIFVMAGNLTETTKEFIRIKNQELPNDITFDCLEIKDLLGLIGNPNSPMCLLRPFENEYFISRHREGRIKKLVATVTATELKKIYDRIGAPTLFSLNPRSYLGHRGISKGITETIQKEPDKLWHYNNGVSAVCRRFDHDEKTGAIKIDNLKIVNGCQTVTTISRPSNLNPDASIVFRLSEVNDNKFRENVSKYTNSQNRIVSPDLASDHRYLLKLEKRFASYTPFFWERKKGTAAYMDKELKKRIAGKRDLYIIKNPDAARLKMAYMGNPHLSIQLSQQKLFDDEATQDGSSYFQDLYKDADPRDFIVPHVLHYWLDIIKKRLGTAGTNNESDNVKNIRFLLKYRIGRQYVIAIVAKIISSVNDTNVKNHLIAKIINVASDYDEDVTEKLIDELKKLTEWVAHITPKVLEKVESDDNNEILMPPLHTKEMYYLRDRLRNVNRLGSFYIERESLCKFVGGQEDQFLANLRSILKV